jgi:hypothetical protein
MRSRQWLALERTDHDAIGEGSTGDVRPAILVDHRCLGRATQRLNHGYDSLCPRLHGADEFGTDRVEDSDLAVVDEAARQVGELRLRHEPG